MKKRLIYIIGVVLLLLNPVLSSAQISYQYWIDDNKDAAVSGTTTDGTAFNLSIDAADLSSGIHFFNIRAREGKKWGSVQRQLFCIPREQQAAGSNLITGYRYGFGDALTTVTLASPVSEYTLVKTIAVPEPPLPTTIDDDCHFSFDDSEATLLRNINMTFALTFTDESNAMSSPVGTTFTMTDTRTSDIETLSVPGELTVSEHAAGGYTVIQFDVPIAGTYILKSTTESSLRLYSSEGAFLKTVTPSLLATGSLQDLEATSYYAVVFGNEAETSLSIDSEDPNLFTVATPTITHEGNVVTITTTTSNASIYYTLDGNMPTAESLLYTEPFTVTENCTIFAIGKRDGYKDSGVASLDVDWIEVATICGYAIYDSETTTLTFKYGLKPNGDNVWETENTTFDTNNPAPWVSENLTKVVFDASYADVRPTSTAWWFSNASKLTEIVSLENLNTSKVTDMEYMFNGCSGLTSLDLRSFDTSNVTSMFCMFRFCSMLTNLDLSNFNTEKVTDMPAMFYHCSSLTTLDLSSFNTANVTNMVNMFFGCSRLTNLDLSNFNTANVTDMENMFSWCSGLTSLNLGNFNTANVTNMSWMFYKCSALTSLDVSNFNTDKVTEMSSMFSGCSSLKTIFCNDAWTCETSNGMFNGCTSLTGAISYDNSKTDVTYANPTTGYFTEKVKDVYAVLSEDNTVLTFYYDYSMISRGGMNVGPFTTGFDSNWNWSVDSGWYGNRESITTAVFDASFADCTILTSTAYWFYGCKNLTIITGISNMKTDNVTDMGYMFCGCSALTSLDVSNFNTANVTNMGGIFSGCSTLTSLDVSKFNTAKVTSMYGMFKGCSALTSLDVSNFNTAKVTDMSNMFDGCSGLTSLDLSNFNTANVTDMGHMFTYCSGLTSLNVSNFNTANVTNMNGMFSSCHSLKTLDLSNFNTANVTGMNSMFSICPALTSLDVSNFNTSNVVDISAMFGGCSGLTSLDVSKFNTENVKYMSSMFNGCSALTSLDVSKFNTENVKYMGGMFYGCSGLTSIDLSNFNTANVTDMGLMFTYCSGLTSLNVSNFNTANVEDMCNMFNGCSALTSLDLSNFNTANVMNMSYMFFGCSGLTSLDLSNFNTANVTDMRCMFQDCSKLKTVYCNDAWTCETSNWMFLGCTSLVGAISYGYDKIDATYANPTTGYFTPKPFTLGDANGDGEVNMADAVAIVNKILGNESAGFNFDAADVNHDGKITISDAVGVVNIIQGQ